jgi:hypothetical protein
MVVGEEMPNFCELTREIKARIKKRDLNCNMMLKKLKAGRLVDAKLSPVRTSK